MWGWGNRLERGRTPAPIRLGGFLTGGEEDYERPAEAAAAAFLAALAVVEALRRRLVFGGVAGASPMSSAVMMLVTNNLGPWSSKSIAVRSMSEAVTIPKPYTPCLMVCPSCITCTTSSLTTRSAGLNLCSKLFARRVQIGRTV